MPSTAPAAKISANYLVNAFRHDPDSTSAIVASRDGGTTKQVVDMLEYCEFLVKATVETVGGSGLTQLEIVAATDSAISSGVTQIKTTTIAGDAVGDTAVLECTDQDLQAVGVADLRYVAARLTMATASDECAVAYVAKSKRPHRDITATAIS